MEIQFEKVEMFKMVYRLQYFEIFQISMKLVVAFNKRKCYIYFISVMCIKIQNTVHTK